MNFVFYFLFFISAIIGSLTFHPDAPYIFRNFKLAITLERREFLTILMNNIK